MNDSGDIPSDAEVARTDTPSEQPPEPASPAGEAADSTGESTAQPQPDTTPAEADNGQAQAEPSPAKPKGKGKGGKQSGTGGGKGRKSNGRKNSARRSVVAAIPWDEPLALVRYGRMSQVGVFRHNIDPPPRRDTEVVIRTDRGVELGVVVSSVDKADPPADPAPDATADTPAETADCIADCKSNCQSHCLINTARLQKLGAEGGSEYTYNRANRILRLASNQDVNDQIHLDRTEREKKVYCKQQAVELGLDMRMVAVEHLLGGERVIFYFTSENRVDFRELVRRLAGQYRTRIEMRQIGARDEARLVGDYERCGRQCCCQTFLGELQPVSIRMAKVQKATLDPPKISGRCNRLMCCLRYEDETYEDLRKRLPKRNVWVRTEEIIGKVVSSQILTQLVRVVDVHGAMSVIHNEDILERGVTPPDPATTRPVRPRRSSASAAPKPAGAGDQPADKTPESGEGAKPKRRRRRRRKPKGEGSAPAKPAEAKAAQGGSGESADQPKKKRRRRRRRKPKGEGGSAQSGGSSPAS